MIKKGQVFFSSGGNYKVFINEDELYIAKPIGIFRKERIKILVGDIVDLKLGEVKKGFDNLNTIVKLYPRKNYFIRPNVTNIDCAIIITSITRPNLADYLLDKLITQFNMVDVDLILIFTKADLEISEQNQKKIDEYIAAGFKVLISANGLSEKDIEIFKSWTTNKLSVLAGQSGVGKSTLINSLGVNFNLPTDEISERLGRGKHTTRHLEIFEIFAGAFVIDTPGFSSFSVENYKVDNLSRTFFNFEKYADHCEFNNCAHVNEPNCAVRNAVKAGDISSKKYQNYLKLREEMKELDNYK